MESFPPCLSVLCLFLILPAVKAFSIVKLGILQNSNYKDWPFPLDICREDLYKLNWEQGGGHRPDGLSNQGIT